MTVSRRRFIISSAAAAAAISGAAVLTAKKFDRIGLNAESNEFYTSLPIPRLIDARETDNNIVITAKPGVTQFLPNLDANSYGYSASYLGPVLRVYRGDTVRMNVQNELDKLTTVNWHGLFVPSELDGGPYNVIAPGQSWHPALKIDQPATTAWFHPHPHGDAGRQIYMGLAGLIYVEDGSAADLGLPVRYGIDDLPLVLQDRNFGPNGELLYDNSPETIMHGSRGDTIIVNGAIGPVMEVPKGIVRLRLLNGANARNFRLAFNDNRLMHVIASDNGYISAPVEVRELTITPGERFEVLVDFSDGKVAVIHTYPDHLGRPASKISDFFNGIFRNVTDVLIPVIRFDPVEDIPAAAKSLPSKLVELPAPQIPEAAKRRSFILDSMTAINMQLLRDQNTMQGMDQVQMNSSLNKDDSSDPGSAMKMGINGNTFDVARLDAMTKVGDKEIWELRGTEMAHSFHIHGASFRILNLDGAPAPEHLAGPKDTVLVNESAQLLVSFNQKADPSMPFVFHCGIVEHQDAGMMAQYSAA